MKPTSAPDPFSRYKARLQQARDQERERIARDLHDVLGSTLAALKLETRQVCKALETRITPLQHPAPMQPTAHTVGHVDMARILQRIHGLDSLIDQAIESTRALINDHRADILSDFGLAGSLEVLAAEFSRRTGVICAVSSPEDLPEPAEHTAHALYRATQEALTNIMRHARATRVMLRLRQRGDEVELRIDDDGVGFDALCILSPASTGIRNMRERLHALGGSCTLESTPGRGTRITLRASSGAPEPSPALAHSS